MEEQQSQQNIFEVLEKVKPLLRTLRKWLIPALAAGVLLAGYMAFQERKKPVLFTGETTFILEDDLLNSESGGTGMNPLISALAGQSVSGNKALLVDLAKSTMLIEKTLLMEAELHGKKTILANYMAERSGWLGSWKNSSDPKLKNFSYSAQYRVGTLSEPDAALRSMAASINSKLICAKMESGLFIMKYTSDDEEFTSQLLKKHLEQISQYYINKKLEKAQSVFKFAQQRHDSLRRVVSGQDSRLATIQDRSLNMIMARGKIPEMQTRRDMNVSNLMYQESVLALSQARMDLEKKRPFITMVDDPRLPLPHTRPSTMMKGIIGFIAGFILVLVGVGIFIFVSGYLRQEKAKYVAEKNSNDGNTP